MDWFIRMVVMQWLSRSGIDVLCKFDSAIVFKKLLDKNKDFTNVLDTR